MVARLYVDWSHILYRIYYRIYPKCVKVSCGQKRTSLMVEKYQSTVWWKDGFHTKSTRKQRSYLMFAAVKSLWTWGLRKGRVGLSPLTLTRTRGRPKRPALTSPLGCPDILSKNVRKSRCIRRTSGVESGLELQNLSKPLHPKIAIILDLSEHVDVNDDPEEAEQCWMIHWNLPRILSILSALVTLSTLSTLSARRCERWSRGSWITWND